jgi:hypothetical protein
MSCLVFGFDQELAIWASSKIPHMRGRSFGLCRSVGIMRGTDPSDMSAPMQAVVVFHDFHEIEKTCQVSVASRTPMWARRDLIAGLLSYPFDQLGVNMIWSAMRHEDERTIRFNEHLGFRRDATLRHRFGWKQHAVVTSMTKHEYARLWKNGQVVSVSA